MLGVRDEEGLVVRPEIVRVTQQAHMRLREGAGVLGSVEGTGKRLSIFVSGLGLRFEG